MKRILAMALAVVMVIGCASMTFAAESKTYSGSSGGSVAVKKATTTVAATGTAGTWNYNAATNKWSFADAAKVYKSSWVLATNPYASNSSQWFYFDEFGNMVTGWVWIKGADGVTRCYYLNPLSNGSLGACYLNGTTPDGYTVDANGAWTMNGVVQTK